MERKSSKAGKIIGACAALVIAAAVGRGSCGRGEKLPDAPRVKQRQTALALPVPRATAPLSPAVPADESVEISPACREIGRAHV